MKDSLWCVAALPLGRNSTTLFWYRDYLRFVVRLRAIGFCLDGLGLCKINEFRVTFGGAIFALGMSGLVCYKEILSVSVMVGCASLWGVVLFTPYIYIC